MGLLYCFFFVAGFLLFFFFLRGVLFFLYFFFWGVLSVFTLCYQIFNTEMLRHTKVNVC